MGFEKNAGVEWISSTLECCGSWWQDCTTAVQQVAQTRFLDLVMFWSQKTRVRFEGWGSIRSICWRVMFWLKNHVLNHVFTSDCTCVEAGSEVLKYHILLTVRKFSKCLEKFDFFFQSNFWLLIFDEPISCLDKI